MADNITYQTYCPMSFNQQHPKACMKEQCSWYDKKQNQCGIFSLSETASNFKNVVDNSTRSIRTTNLS